MKKGFKVVYITFFLILILMPVVLINTEQNQKSEIDNRKLVEFPEILGNDEIKKDIEKYLQDRIGFRKEMMSSYSWINTIMYGELAHPLYQFGQDGYVFFDMHNNITYESYHKIFAEAVQKMQVYCESRGAKFYFLFDPEKISVYRRYLPEGVNYDDSWADDMLAYMRELNISVISNKDILTDLSYSEQVFNRQYDAGHWNDLGCFYGTNNLWNTMKKEFPAITEYAKEDFEVSTKIETYYPVSSIVVNEEVPVYRLKTKWKDVSADYYGINLDKNYKFFQYCINQAPNAQNYPKVLFFQGSYYNRGSQFIIGRTREYIGVHDYQNVMNLDYYFNIFQPEAVVFEAAEYTFSDNYFDSKRMESLDYNPFLQTREYLEDDIISDRTQIIDNNTYLCVIPGNGFDIIYYDEQLPKARYVYLQSGNSIFDMQEGNNGFYSTGVPHNAIQNAARIIYTDYTGKTYYIDVGVRNAQKYINDIEYSQGSYYDEWNNQYVFKTSLHGNYFNSVNLQLYDGITDSYITNIYSVNSSGNYSDAFIHTNNTGWYKIWLKANSNIQDEGMEMYIYLVQGERYFFSFEVTDFQVNKICIGEYSMYGVCPWIYGEEELMNTIEKTIGCDEIADNKYCFSTNMAGNRFSCIALNLINAETGDLIDTISVEAENGKYSGRYVHKGSNDMYLIKFMGNTNLQDEYIIAKAPLIQGMMYKWSYEIDSLGPTEAVISNVSFSTIGNTGDL